MQSHHSTNAKTTIIEIQHTQVFIQHASQFNTLKHITLSAKETKKTLNQLSSA